MRIVYTGGGTAGHVFPALAVHRVLEERVPGLEAVWIGSRKGPERGWVEEAGVRFYGVPAGKWRRYLSVKNVVDVGRVGVGVMASLLLLRRLRPRVVFSKGGYVAVPPVIAASILGIPVVVHESDLDPGLATRITARYASRILTSWPETATFFPREWEPRVVCTGNPVRPEVRSGDPGKVREFFPVRPGRPLLLVLGGSQGARQVNELVWAALPRLLEWCEVIHQTGPDVERAPRREGYHPVAFLGRELPHVLSAAQVVVSRAGAGAVAELAACGKAAVLVPLGRELGSRGDQVRNARRLAERGAAVVLEGGEAVPARLVQVVEGLMRDEGRRRALEERIRELARPDAAEAIARVLEGFLSESPTRRHGGDE
ncbi:UDP-N-acetylglucosamine--N-acetylmuramyl- (pentapeptide) pyrophosphoryl-undecaprenol N-acetylglucosamine transferase [Spirochaeta thermophila DSM 6578]|uniref:UDP-N-acetylglucosamine--N-acetylmuramyl-(pentapeptide) pyrophosphoryl-undecaprenol N-acetylglucosamine transferase n=1 Tax=Winmispira thermophila (strain ATCC 700085 / DSM 6578 / Z-1203) TaxID=869211 RepID=G0G9U2_WINT7|nr:undecaprenyldiphospho-muramoylpentapeptide beta-N-acetylglucosaminyltransferase [Spirochaeta thermophila]AEJ60842.1 UDP-N-acetylglucosamine--N-acetylmuramyl- (pentapeptide) pyrophosphoryl-undecaprenol N-acetylglucosamine transferase [Spirochaeta thermophila DSM 6578]